MRNHKLDAAMRLDAFHAGEAMPQAWTSWDGEGWWKLLRAAKRSVLMLDYDGTLAPFHKDRMLAHPYPGVSERLVQLANIPRSRLVFVSGRPARELSKMLPAAIHSEIWGSHGRDHLLADGSYEVEPLDPAQQEALVWLGHSLDEQGFSASIEEKPGSLALHVRELDTAESVRLIGAIELRFTEIKATGLELLQFDGGVEVRGSGRTKATAVESILEDEPKDVVTAYLGDDLTDEDAFRALKNGGLRALVRSEAVASAADLWLRPPEEMLAFLDRWLDAVGIESAER